LRPRPARENGSLGLKGTVTLFIIILMAAAGVALAVLFPFQTLVVFLLAIIAISALRDFVVPVEMRAVGPGGLNGAG